jgi:hypothetical protein
MTDHKNHKQPPLLERVLVDGTCPRCGAEELRRYPVVAEAGWVEVVKCQNCLCSVQRRPWHRLGPIQLLADQI